MIRLIGNKESWRQTILIAHGDGDGDGENLHFMALEIKRNSRHLEIVIPLSSSPPTYVTGLPTERAADRR